MSGRVNGRPSESAPTPSDDGRVALPDDAISEEFEVGDGKLTPRELERLATATFAQRLHILSETSEARQALRALATAAALPAVTALELASAGPHGLSTDLPELALYGVTKFLLPRADLIPDIPFHEAAARQLKVEALTAGVLPSLTLNFGKQAAIDRKEGRYEDASYALSYLATGRPGYYERLVGASADLDQAAGEFVDAEGVTREIVGRVDKYQARAERIEALEAQENMGIFDKLELLSLRAQNWSAEKPEEIPRKIAKVGAVAATVGLVAFAGYEAYLAAPAAWETIQQTGGILKSAADLGAVDWKSIFHLSTVLHPGDVLGPAFTAYGEQIKQAYADTLVPFSETLTDVAKMAVSAVSAYGFSRAARTTLRQNSTIGPQIGRLGEWASLQGNKLKRFFSREEASGQGEVIPVEVSEEE